MQTTEYGDTSPHLELRCSYFGWIVLSLISDENRHRVHIPAGLAKEAEIFAAELANVTGLGLRADKSCCTTRELTPTQRIRVETQNNQLTKAGIVIFNFVQVAIVMASVLAGICFVGVSWTKINLGSAEATKAAPSVSHGMVFRDDSRGVIRQQQLSYTSFSRRLS